MFDPQAIKIQAIATLANEKADMQIDCADVIKLVDLIEAQATKISECRRKNVLLSLKAIHFAKKLHETEAELLTYKYPQKRRRWFARK